MRGPLSRRNRWILQNEFPGDAERWTVWTVGAEQNRGFVTNPNCYISPSPTPTPFQFELLGSLEDKELEPLDEGIFGTIS